MKIFEVELPPVSDPRFHRMMQRGHEVAHFQPIPKTTFNQEQRYQVLVKPRGGTPYTYRRSWEPGVPERTSYYDPEIADLETHDPGEQYLEFTRAKLKPGFAETIPSLGPDFMYRGGSHEEMEFFLKTGQIKSDGSYNIGDNQIGLTYWTDDPQSAISYANSFAPVGHKATFEHPAYVWVAHMVDPSEIKPVKGTATHEIGVIRPITANEIVQIWRGRVYDYSSGDLTLVPHDNNSFRIGGASMPSGYVMWERIK